ncbi:MAG: phage capsid protein [Pseudomonadota bacterium]
MAHPEAQIYSREFIRSFNQSVSLLSDRCTEEAMSFGRSATFDVADLGGDLAQRSIDGRLPRLTSNDTQPVCTLEEYGGKMEVTSFEKFTSQSNEREKMYAKMMARANRRLDKNLITELDNASTQYDSGNNPHTLNVDTLTDIVADLAQNEVDISPEDVTFLCTPKAARQIKKSAQYSSQDYVNVKPYSEGDQLTYGNKRQIRVFADIGLITSPLLPGMGTNAAKCFIFHRNAVGCAKPTEQMITTAGWDDQDHFHYCSSSIKLGHKILQNGGIFEVVHDDTAA